MVPRNVRRSPFERASTDRQELRAAEQQIARLRASLAALQNKFRVVSTSVGEEMPALGEVTATLKELRAWERRRNRVNALWRMKEATK